MHSIFSRAGGLRRLRLFVLFGAAVLGACSDAPSAPSARLGTAIPSTALQALDCTVSVSTGAVRCEPARASLGGASAVTYGGQNSFVRLTSTGVSYNAATDVFSMNVTVQNLMNEAVGTLDGTVADPQGIQVFFVSDIATTGGSGTVTVINHDGTGFFTAASQEYFSYPEILAKDQVSSEKPWQFSVPGTVTSFYFTVLIETDVQYLLVINEVMVTPAAPINQTEGEWVELYNAGTRPVDLQNLVITDSAASGRRPYHEIASSVVVPSGGYVVLGRTTNTTLNGGVPVDYAWGGTLMLAPSLDAVKISRVFGTDTLTIDRTQYSQSSTSALSGISRELKNPGLDNSNMDGSEWAPAAVTAVYGAGGRGTPKAQNSAYTP